MLISRGDYWQAAWMIQKDSFLSLKDEGLARLRERLARTAPFLEGAVEDLREWDLVRRHSVRVDRLLRWHRPGFLGIGDAAHAMSPVGGVGINLAAQDAVATANLLFASLLRERLGEEALAAVQARPAWPARPIQRAQVAIHRRLLFPILEARPPLPAPWFARDWFPLLRLLPRYAVGVGCGPSM